MGSGRFRARGPGFWAAVVFLSLVTAALVVLAARFVALLLAALG